MGVQGIMGISYLSNCRPVNLSTFERFRGKYSSSIAYGYSVHFTCRPVNLSTCLPGLTGQDVIGLQGIMATSYLFTCQPVYQG